MTNDAIRAVVITGKYAVRASPREKRNIYSCYTDDSHRSICMQHWNEQQPRGQGLLANFEVHYKNLSEAEKQVHC